MQAQQAMTPQPAGNMMSSIAHTLVPPPYKQDVPHPPAQHNISTMNELVLEGQVYPLPTLLITPETDLLSRQPNRLHSGM